MRRAFISSVIAIVLLLAAISCRSGGDLSKPETQRQFGVRMAKMNLWREATFRFRRAVQIDPNNATAHNNLAVALEATGDFDTAAKEYREALRLDRSNQYIQKNYSRFVEFTTRAKKAAVVPKPTATTTAAPATTATTTTVAPAPAPPAPPAPAPTDTAATSTTTTNPPDGGPR